MNVKPLIGLVTLAGLAWLPALAGCEKDPLPAADMDVTVMGKTPAISDNAGEVDLVEKMSEARLAYKAYLEAMDRYYTTHGEYTKQVGVEKELGDFRKARKYTYLVVTDLPAPELTKPTTNIPEANVLFEDGMNYYKGGRVLGVPLAYSTDKMRKAVEKFDLLIKQYPSSDKVADAFFYAAEILKEYLGENLKAIEYYQRAYEADPNIAHPAHYQRAVVLDYRLHRRDEAVAEYRQVIDHEAGKNFPWAKSNSDFAATRIRELTSEK